MKALSLILLVFIVLNISFGQECTELEAQCTSDPNCAPFANQAELCTVNTPPYNNTYGCEFDNENE